MVKISFRMNVFIVMFCDVGMGCGCLWWWVDAVISERVANPK